MLFERVVVVQARNPRRQELIAKVLDDLARLSD
jgi:hypothetical protein